MHGLANFKFKGLRKIETCSSFDGLYVNKIYTILTYTSLVGTTL